MRLADVTLAFPTLLLLIAMVAAFQPSMGVVFATIGVVGWAGIARLVRGQVLVVRQLEFIQAIRALGARDWRIMLQHVLPNVIAPVVIAATLGVAGAIMAEAALSFVGLGARPPTPSWGAMVADGRDLLRVAPWVSIVPGLAIDDDLSPGVGGDVVVVEVGPAAAFDGPDAAQGPVVGVKGQVDAVAGQQRWHVVVAVLVELVRRAVPIVGPAAEESARRFFVDVAFLSTKGFLPEEGTFESAMATFRIKQIIAEQAGRVCLLVDHSKFGRRALCKVLDVAQIDEVITDAEAPADARAALAARSALVAPERRGVTLRIAAGSFQPLPTSAED